MADHWRSLRRTVPCCLSPLAHFARTAPVTITDDAVDRHLYRLVCCLVHVLNYLRTLITLPCAIAASF